MKRQCREPCRRRRVLPGELVYKEILTRLHIKTLSRFLCVSKAWNSVISSPPIKHDKPLLVRMLVKGTTLQISTYNSQGTLIDKFRKSVPQETRPVQAVNGLLCFAGRDKKVILLCNPSTRERETLPLPPGSPHDVCIGFGHVASTDEFKVVKFSGRCCLQILTLGWRNGCTGWRKLATRPPYRPAAGFAPPFVNGALHLLPDQSYRYELLRHKPIVAFDLETEKYREFELPPHYYQKSCRKHRIHKERLAELRGSLCFVEQVEGHLVLWLLKDYCDSSTWVKQYNIDTSMVDSKIRRPICSWRAWPCTIMDDGCVLFVNHRKHENPIWKYWTKLWCYDPRDNTFSRPKIGSGCSATICQQQFLPPLKHICARHYNENVGARRRKHGLLVRA